MIGYLRGNIIRHDIKNIILDVHGVGYKVFVNFGDISSPTHEGKQQKPREIELFTYMAVRENALDLYGFEKKEEMDFFELLLTVSGIGPKSAMAILSVAPLSLLKQAISTEDSSLLTKTAGIGKKNAEKIVLELKDKIGTFVSDGSVVTSGHDDAIEALKSLGYSERESRDALKKAIGDTTEDKVRSALKNLNK